MRREKYINYYYLTNSRIQKDSATHYVQSRF
nr:MAG TPA: hypothetical protein [Caudoviricetes sp.]